MCYRSLVYKKGPVDQHISSFSPSMRLVLFLLVLMASVQWGGTVTSCRAGTEPDDALEVCEECLAGEFKAGDNLEMCEACQHGSNSTSGSEYCNICEEGFEDYYIAYIGSHCDTCKSGFYNDYTGSEWDCVACPSNSHADRFTSTAAIDCECLPGYTTSSVGVGCVPCTAGTFKTVFGQTECEICPPVTPSTVYTSTTAECQCTAESPALCASCPANSFKKDTVHTETADYMQCSCLPGFGGVGGLPPCSACAPGASVRVLDETLHYQTPPNECQCSAGFGGTDGLCVECPTDTFKTWGPGECTACPAHSTTILAGGESIEACACSTGYESVLPKIVCGGDCGCDGDVAGGVIDTGIRPASHTDQCWWIITAPLNSNAKVVFTAFETFDNLDTVHVQQCADATCSSGVMEIATLSGLPKLDEVYTSSTPFMKLLFVQKGGAWIPGFKANTVFTCNARSDNAWTFNWLKCLFFQNP